MIRRRSFVLSVLPAALPLLQCTNRDSAAKASVDSDPGATAAQAQLKHPFYVGSHQHGWPDNTDRFASGTFVRSKFTMEPFDYGPIRSHNVEALNSGAHNRWWTGHESGQNRYDWKILDGWVDKVTSRGHSILLNLFGVPEFAARLRDYRDVYGVVGGTSGPADLPAWQAFVRDTTARIIERNGRRSLVAVEAWNEPIGDDVGGNGQFLVSRAYAPDRPDPQATLLAEITKHTYLGVRAVASAEGLPVLCGAQAYLDNRSVCRLLNATTMSGEPILRFCDALSFHPYGVHDANGVRPSLTEFTRSIRRRLSAMGAPQFPLWASEVGLNAPWNDRVSRWWGRLDAPQRAEALYDWVKQYKQLGWQAVFTYSSESTDDFLGLPHRNPEIAAALSRAYRELQQD